VEDFVQPAGDGCTGASGGKQRCGEDCLGRIGYFGLCGSDFAGGAKAYGSEKSIQAADDGPHHGG
jgi:hypothetical protein